MHAGLVVSSCVFLMVYRWGFFSDDKITESEGDKKKQETMLVFEITHHVFCFFKKVELKKKQTLDLYMFKCQLVMNLRWHFLQSLPRDFFLRYIAWIVDVKGKQSPGSKNTEIAALCLAALKFR